MTQTADDDNWFTVKDGTVITDLYQALLVMCRPFGSNSRATFYCRQSADEKDVIELDHFSGHYDMHVSTDRFPVSESVAVILQAHYTNPTPKWGFTDPNERTLNERVGWKKLRELQRDIRTCEAL